MPGIVAFLAVLSRYTRRGQFFQKNSTTISDWRFTLMQMTLTLSRYASKISQIVSYITTPWCITLAHRARHSLLS